MHYPVITAIQYQLRHLKEVLQQLHSEDYTRKSVYMSGATVGQHSRHIIELLQCLLLGYEVSIVDYDSRKRNIVLETNHGYAIEMLDGLAVSIIQKDKPLTFFSSYHESGDAAVQMQTTYMRELAYNLEHTIHHMALLKAAFIEFGITIAQENFGVAYATIQYRQSCVQ